MKLNLGDRVRSELDQLELRYRLRRTTEPVTIYMVLEQLHEARLELKWAMYEAWQCALI